MADIEMLPKCKRQSDEEAAARYGNPYVCEVRGGWWRSYWMKSNLQWCHKSFRTEAQARTHSATKHNPRYEVDRND